MLILGIRAKLLLLIMAATIVPLLSLNLYWTNSQRQSLKKATHARQTLITENDAASVNDFLNEKVRTLIIHAQSPNMQQFNDTKTSLEISTLLYQDKDLTRVALVNSEGKELLALKSDLTPSPLADVKNSDAFKVTTYFSGHQYISPVTTSVTGHPTITIAVPLLNFTTPQDLGGLSTAEPGVVRNPKDIKGALVAEVSLENLWNSVLSKATDTSNTDTPENGYAYVIDDKGAVIAHPDSTLASAQKDLSTVPIVSLFKSNLGNQKVTSGSFEGTSEKGVKVVATYQSIPATNWGVVFQEPISSIYKGVNRVSEVGLILADIVIIVMAFLSFGLSRYITEPVIRITRAAERMGRGDFSGRIKTKRTDEIGELSNSINAMGENLQGFVGHIETQRRQLEVILNSTTDGILAIDDKDTIIIANQATAQLCELETSELVGKKIQALFSWSHNAEPFEVDYQAAGTHTHLALQYTGPSDVVHYINLITVKTSTQTIVTMHDETKSRELENMKVDFVSMAAHELRTPLSRIRGYLELVAAQPPEDLNDKVRNFIEQSHNSAVELSTLISNLLDVSRIERGNLVLAMDKVDFADIAAQATEGLKPSAAAKKITVSYTGAEHERYIVADSVAIKEVVNNLIDNAIHYTPLQGRVDVTLSQTADDHVLEVKDTGIGIPANAIPYLFTKFYRVHGGLESGSSGTGLGLFISKSIVERHNGTIAVKSTEGHGSTFTVTIPIFNEENFAKIRETEGLENVSKRRGWTTTNITR